MEKEKEVGTVNCSSIVHYIPYLYLGVEKVKEVGKVNSSSIVHYVYTLFIPRCGEGKGSWYSELYQYCTLCTLFITRCGEGKGSWYSGL